MLKKLQARIAREESGFTLLELLVVIVILGILLAIAVPAYLGFKGRSQFAAAQSDVRSALPSVEAWASDHSTSGYTSMTVASLTAAYDKGFPKSVTIGAAATTSYCIESQIDATHFAHVSGPGGTIGTSTAAAC